MSYVFPPPQPYLHVERKAAKKGSFAVVTIKREPVNSMNRDVWKQLLSTLKELENEKGMRAVVFRSGLKKDVFTAGNDINELFPKHTNEVKTKRRNEMK